MVFKDVNEVRTAYQNGYVHLHTKIGFQASSLAKLGLPLPIWTEKRNLFNTEGKAIFTEI